MAIKRKKDTGEQGNRGEFGTVSRDEAQVGITRDAAGELAPPERHGRRIHAGARVESGFLGIGAVVEEDAWVFGAASTGQDPFIGERAVLGARSVSGDHLELGSASTLASRTQAGDRVALADRAFVRERARLGNDVSVGEGAVVGKKVRVGDRVAIGDESVIDDSSIIGDDVQVDPGLRLRAESRIQDGEHVTLEHPFAVPKPETPQGTVTG